MKCDKCEYDLNCIGVHLIDVTFYTGEVRFYLLRLIEACMSCQYQVLRLCFDIVAYWGCVPDVYSGLVFVEMPFVYACRR